MRKKKIALNTLTSLILQITVIVSGFIIPRLILSRFGSEVNGLVQSVTNFLGVIAYLELGVGAVVQSALYKPLADCDNNMVSKIYVSASKFFKNLARMLLIYVVILTIAYPMMVNSEFDFAFTGTLIIAMSINSFAQYYFGIANRLLLTADQKGYVQYTAQIVTLIINTIACAVLIHIGASIQIVKLVTSLIYLARPLALYFYVRKHYEIDYNINYTEEPIKQKWNGVAQHIAAIVLDNTDTIVLTIFSTLSNVSIYSVYHLVVYGVKQLVTSLTSGVQSLLGELWARQEQTTLDRVFALTEWGMHTGVTFLFGCTAALAVPFVQVYTKGITDASYSVPVFALLISLAHGFHGLRMPYHIMILAAGHYKQTQKNYIVATLINVVVSVITVNTWGLVGVAIGTLIAMLYQTLWMAWYNSKNLIGWPIKKVIKQLLTDSVSFITAFYISRFFKLTSITYSAWFLLAIKVALIWLVAALCINFVFYKKNVIWFLTKMRVKKLTR